MSKRWATHLRWAVLAVLLATALPALAQEPAPADSIRTNIWLVESLMSDIVEASTLVLPPAPATLLLEMPAADEENEVFAGVAFRILSEKGYEMVQVDPEAEETAAPAHDVRYGYRVAGIDLVYPEVGRTMGLWRRWVGRDIEVAVFVQISESESGRVLLSNRVARSFSDRVPNKHFDDVNSNLYTFTTAETEESGWQRRTEEIVVLGALAALVAIYFANTGN